MKITKTKLTEMVVNSIKRHQLNESIDLKDISKSLKNDLKEIFPNGKFKLKLNSAKGTVTITYDDFVPKDNLKIITNKYKDIIPFLFVERNMSDNAANNIVKNIKSRFGHANGVNDMTLSKPNEYIDYFKDSTYNVIKKQWAKTKFDKNGNIKK